MHLDLPDLYTRQRHHVASRCRAIHLAGSSLAPRLLGRKRAPSGLGPVWSTPTWRSRVGYLPVEARRRVLLCIPVGTPSAVDWQTGAPSHGVLLSPSLEGVRGGRTQVVFCRVRGD